MTTTELARNVPMPMAELRDMAKIIVASKLFGITDESVAVGLMLLCASDGLHPVQAMRRYHVISGRPAMKAETMLAEYQSHGGKITWLRCDTTGAKAEFASPGMGAPCTVEWTEADARAAGVLSNPTWKKFPRAMYRSRVISEGVRMAMPGVVLGVYTPDETENFAPSSELPRSPDPVLTTADRAMVAERLKTVDVVYDDAEHAHAADDDDDIGDLVEVFQEGESVGMRDGASKAQKARAHILKKTIGIDDGTWKERLQVNFSKSSMTDLSYEEADELIAKLEQRLETYGSAADKAARQQRRLDSAVNEIGTTLANLDRVPGMEG